MYVGYDFPEKYVTDSHIAFACFNWSSYIPTSDIHFDMNILWGTPMKYCLHSGLTTCNLQTVNLSQSVLIIYITVHILVLVWFYAIYEGKFSLDYLDILNIISDWCLVDTRECLQVIQCLSRAYLLNGDLIHWYYLEGRL